MDPEVKSSLLWGVVGGLAFLVFVQGYQLLTEEFVAVEVVVGIGVVVGVVAATGTHLIRTFLRREEGDY